MLLWCLIAGQLLLFTTSVVMLAGAFLYEEKSQATEGRGVHPLPKVR